MTFKESIPKLSYIKMPDQIWEQTVGNFFTISYRAERVGDLKMFEVAECPLAVEDMISE